MKNYVTVVIFVFFSVVILNSQDVNSQLDTIKQLYLNGDLDKALQTIDILKNQIYEEKNSKDNVDYISLKDWEPMKTNPEGYIGKKVKLPAIFRILNKDGTVALLNVSNRCTFDKMLIDKVAKLMPFSTYTFYGTVSNSNDGPLMNIERLSQ